MGPARYRWTTADCSAKWKELFAKLDVYMNINDDIINHLFDEVMHKYCCMSVGQRRTTYVQEIKRETQEAHRRQIKIKASDKYLSKCDFNLIMADTSKHKQVSHLILLSERHANKNYIDSTLFTHDQL